tara:strand:+ start:913 stop:1239 length:327 start_codon:yes stop_codon:yes gene_type:complete
MASLQKNNTTYKSIVECFESMATDTQQRRIIFNKDTSTFSVAKKMYLNAVIDDYNEGLFDGTLLDFIETKFDEVMYWENVEQEYANVWSEEEQAEAGLLDEDYFSDGE